MPGLLARSSTMVRPNPSDFRLADEPPPSDATLPENSEPAPDPSVSPLTESNTHAAPADVFTQLLNQIAERACLATSATASAIALRYGDQIICRATAGPNAPDVGVALNPNSGLSGACIRTGEAQYCEDTERDPRVNAEASRRLQVRSVLVIPLLYEEDLMGIFEIFSPLPQAFARHDLQNLESLSRVILERLDNPPSPPPAPHQDDPQFPVISVASLEPEPLQQPQAMSLDPDDEPLFQLQETQPQPEPLPQLPLPSPAAEDAFVHPEVPIPLLPQPDLPPVPFATVDSDAETPRSAMESSPLPSSPSPAAPPHLRDWTTGFLTVIVIAVALLLGWMLGRAGWQHAAGVMKAQEQLASSSPSAAPPGASKPSRNTPSADSAASEAVAADSAAQNTPLNAREPGPSDRPAADSRRARGEPEPDPEPLLPGGLVVYEKGKIIFQQTEIRSKRNAVTPMRGTPNASSSQANALAAVSLPPQLTGLYLVHRVEPVYPEQARQHYIQGEVLFEALVGKDGAVQELKLISGNTQLAAAAADAVRQWRFKPYEPNGKAVDFSTRLSVNFHLH